MKVDMPLNKETKVNHQQPADLNSTIIITISSLFFLQQR